MSAFNTVKGGSGEDCLDQAFYQEALSANIDNTCIGCFYKKLQLNNEIPHLILQLYDYVKGTVPVQALDGHVGV